MTSMGGLESPHVDCYISVGDVTVSPLPHGAVNKSAFRTWLANTPARPLFDPFSARPLFDMNAPGHRSDSRYAAFSCLIPLSASKPNTAAGVGKSVSPAPVSNY